MKKEDSNQNLNPSALTARLLAAAPLLTAWFQENARPLPWREQPTPYSILVSETMLQQTRIEAVMRYYPRFMEAFPTPAALAAAREEEVLKLWEGLGYYSRARNLRKAAQLCMEERGGNLPETAAALKKLPGVGAYTAGAVASLAFGEPAPAVDGNVLRILARLTLDERDVLLPTVKKEAEQLLRGVLEQQEAPGRFNEALMELGEMICLPAGKPRCRQCPLQDLCLALARGCQEDLPLRGAPKPRRVEKKTLLLLRHKGRVALVKRPEKGLLAGLYAFPLLEGHLGPGDILPWLKSYGVAFGPLKEAGRARHIFTHVEWEMRGWETETQEALPGYEYADREEVEARYALPSAFRVFREMI